jgi:hypothetical protein
MNLRGGSDARSCLVCHWILIGPYGNRLLYIAAEGLDDAQEPLGGPYLSGSGWSTLRRGCRGR